MALLPESIRGKSEFPLAEDFALAVLRKRLPEVRTQSQIEDDQQAPFILVRRSPELQAWRGHSRFVDVVSLDVECFTEGPDADEDAGLLAEAVRVAFRDAWLENDVYPGLGNLAYHRMTISPHYAPDWATATGPVQYADLPTGFVRYQSTHRLDIRVPRK
jgi:hypothetical protein